MPPVRMTREQYEQQYGKPAPKASTLDTTPAPIRMTRAEYNQAYGKGPQQSDLAGDIALTGKRQTDVVLDTKSDIERINERVQSGDISSARGFGQRFGTFLGGGAKYLAEGARGAAKMVLPEKAEQGVVAFQSAIGERVAQDLQKLQQSENPYDKNLVEKATEIRRLYDTDETFRADVDAAGGVLSALGTALSFGVPKGGSVLSKPDLGGIKETIKTLPQTLKVNTDEKVWKSIAEDIYNIESGYAQTRKAMARQADEGDASRIRLAESDILNGSVDENGVIRTLGQGGAYQKYKQATIGDSESVVKDILLEEGKTINLKDLEAELKYVLMDDKSRFEAEDLVKALEGINGTIKGLALRSDVDGNIPLSVLQDAKTSAYDHIDFNTDKVTQNYRKAIANTYKRVIEDNTELADVKEINSELAKYYEDLSRIKALDGKRVEGGRLGKYSSQIVGSVVGGAVGSVGGGVGAAIGAALGSEIGGRLRSRALMNALKGTPRQITPNSVLQSAKLNIADKPVALKGVKTTPEVENTLFQLNANVIRQEKAIKSGNTTEVVALKQIYDALLEKLDRQLQRIESNSPIRQNTNIQSKNMMTSIDETIPENEKESILEILKNRGLLEDNQNDGAK